MLKKYIVGYFLLSLILWNCKQHSTEKRVKEKVAEKVTQDSKVILIKKLKMEGMEFKIPKTDSVKIILASVNPSDTISTFSYYHDMERGKVFLHQRKVLPIDSAYFVIPFRTSNQKLNGANYIGLFKTDEKKGTPIHLDSYFLGNSIQNLALASMGNQLVATFSSYIDKQTHSENSYAKNTLILEVENNQFVQKKSEQ
ncbi:MAG: hypothetical protein ACK5HU_05810 [Flavobacteriales bacterium]